MQIVKKIINNLGETTHVLLNDGDVTYPIMVDSLHNKIIFTELINSGYEFCGLPYDFRKDGITMDDIPTETNAVFTASEEQDMYDLLDAERYSQSELIPMITKAKVTFLKPPKSEYTIHTREEFLRFLNVFRSDDSSSPFLPLNYFVAPEARFTPDEYVAAENIKYVRKLEEYRQFTYYRYKKFLAWANTPFNTAQDIIDFYFQWGLDGLNLQFVNKTKKQIAAPENSVITGNNAMDALFQKKEIALVDQYGTIHVPEKSKGQQWRSVEPPNIVEEQCRTLKGNDTFITYVKQYVKDISITYDGLEDTFKANTSYVTLNSYNYKGFNVYLSSITEEPISSDLWLAKNESDVYDSAYMTAIAKDALEQRVEPSTASSYKALCLVGYSQMSACSYIAGKLAEMRTEFDITEDPNKVPVNFDKIQNYFRGLNDDEEVVEMVENIIDGRLNIDNIAKMIDMRNMTNISSVYNQIYVMNKILGIPLDEIKKRISSLPDSEEGFTIEGNNLSFTFRLPMDKNVQKAFITDLRDYRVMEADNAIRYIHILRAARELGTPEAKRHVAFEGLSIDTSHPSVIKLLKDIEDKFVAKVMEVIPEDYNKKTNMELKRYFAARAYFDLALNGYYKFPDYLGGEIVSVNGETQQMYAKHMVHVFENITALCDIQCGDLHKSTVFYTNAYVTQDQIIPFKGCTIEQVDFNVVWKDMSANPAVMEKLRERDAIPAQYYAWEDFACDSEHTVVRHFSNSITSLDYYYTNAMEYRKDLDPCEYFVSVPHPCEYLYNLPDSEDSTPDRSPVPLRDGMVKFSVNPRKILTYEDYKDRFDTVTERIEDTRIFNPFFGYNSNDYYTAENLLEKVIPNGIYPVGIQGKDKLLVNGNEIHYTEIEKYADNPDYPIINIWGREYLFRDYKGLVWRVTV